MPVTLRLAGPSADELASLCIHVEEAFRTVADIDLDVRVQTGTSYRVEIAAGRTAPALPAGGPPIASAEGYTLDIRTDGLVGTSHSLAGLRHACLTAAQLAVRCGRHVRFPAGRITDWPRYRWRGFMIDAGRAPCSPARIEWAIRIAALHKLNLLIFREGDDELNAVGYRHLPLGRENPAALAMHQVQSLVAYAAARGVTFVPEVESLGHAGARALHFPALIEGGIRTDYPGVGAHTRKRNWLAADPRTYEVLERIYEEWLALRISPFLHLGLDEVRLPPAEQARHMRGLLPLVGRVASRHGITIRPIVWGDAPPTPKRWRQRVVRCLWDYAQHDAEFGRVGLRNRHLLRQGLRDLFRPDSNECVFMAGGSGSGHAALSKSPDADAIRNLGDWARFGNGHRNVEGLIAVQWGGNQLERWLPDFMAAAEFGWRPPRSGWQPQRTLTRIRRILATYASPADPPTDRVDAPAWDGIWLDGTRWASDIVSNSSP